MVEWVLVLGGVAALGDLVVGVGALGDLLAPGEPVGALVSGTTSGRGVQGLVEEREVVAGEGLADHVGEEGAHHPAHHAVPRRQLGVGLTQRPLQAPAALHHLHLMQPHNQPSR